VSKILVTITNEQTVQGIARISAALTYPNDGFGINTGTLGFETNTGTLGFGTNTADLRFRRPNKP
jgi:hypothetical protein